MHAVWSLSYVNLLYSTYTVHINNYVDELAFTNWIHELHLSMKERELLCNGGLLTANIISAANSLLKRKFIIQNGLQDSHYLATKRKWRSSPNNFVQIIYIEPGHWACLSNKFCPPNVVELFDSLYTIPTKDGTIIQQVCTITRLLNITSPTITINVVQVTPQVGTSDCGLFAISNAYDLCDGIDPFTQVPVQNKMREHLLHCFEEQDIFCFPKTGKSICNRKQRLIKSFSFNIYCTCRGPEVEPMVRCDLCHEWFHDVCVSVPEEVFQYEEVQWTCPNCVCKCRYHIPIHTVPLLLNCLTLMFTCSLGKSNKKLYGHLEWCHDFT